MLKMSNAALFSGLFTLDTIQTLFTVNIELVSVYDKVISGIQIFKQWAVFLNNLFV